MASLIDWLSGRKNIKYEEGTGLGLAIQTIEEFVGRTFSCPEIKPKASGCFPSAKCSKILHFTGDTGKWND